MTACVVCQKRQPNRPQVCDGDRLRLAQDLRELPDLYALIPTVLAPNGSTGEKVSGSREAPVPVSLDVVDLLGPARQPEPTAQAREHPEDVQGGLSVATTLDQWVRMWRDDRSKGERLPAPTVTSLAGWLAVRLDDACDTHTAIDEFATELRGLVMTLRSALNLRRHIERLPAPCPSCDTLALYREVDPHRGASSWVECGNCGRLWSEDEYRRLVVILDEELRRREAARPRSSVGSAA